MRDDGTMDVIAAIDGVIDNGVTHAAGERFTMDAALVPSHVAAGQVRVAGEAKQAAAPRDKQQLGDRTK